MINEQSKQIYLKTETPQNDWEDVLTRLPMQDRPKLPIWRYSMVFAGVAALVFGLAQVSTPGSTLHPIKQASQKTVESFTHLLEGINDDTSVFFPIQPSPTVQKNKVKPTDTPSQSPTIKPTNTKKKNQNALPNNTISPTKQNQQIKGAKTERENKEKNENAEGKQNLHKPKK